VTPNAVFALRLMGAALMLIAGRQLIVAVLGPVPDWATAVTAGASLSLTAASLTFAVAARRDQP